MLSWQSFVTTPEQKPDKSTGLIYSTFGQPSPTLVPAELHATSSKQLKSCTISDEDGFELDFDSEGYKCPLHTEPITQRGSEIASRLLRTRADKGIVDSDKKISGTFSGHVIVDMPEHRYKLFADRTYLSEDEAALVAQTFDSIAFDGVSYWDLQFEVSVVLRSDQLYAIETVSYTTDRKFRFVNSRYTLDNVEVAKGVWIPQEITWMSPPGELAIRIQIKNIIPRPQKLPLNPSRSGSSWSAAFLLAPSLSGVC